MESTHSKHKVFVVADDLGLDPIVNEGIFFALKNGLVGGASLMANGEAFDDAIQGLKDLPDANIGIHLVLVGESSLTRTKLPKNHEVFFIRYILGLIGKDGIAKELEAQIQKILGTGVEPQFINSHQHLHLLPGIMDIVISLAKKYRIDYIRIVNEPILTRGSLFRKFQLIFLNFISQMAKNKIIKAGLMCNDFFIGFIHAGNLDKEDVYLAKKLQSKFPEKIVELGCHPGFESPELIEKYKHWGGYHWRQEIEILSK